MKKLSPREIADEIVAIYYGLWQLKALMQLPKLAKALNMNKEEIEREFENIVNRAKILLKQIEEHEDA